ncbi:MAG: HAD family hydrolase [Nitrospirota bacterium]
MAPSVVILDCDGTLVDSAGHIVAVFNEAIVTLGYAPLPPERVARIIGLSFDDALQHLLPEATADERARIIHVYRAQYAVNAVGRDPLFAGVREFLDLVRGQGRHLAMATGKSRAGALRIIAEHGLNDYFVSVKTGDLCRPKPHPDMLLQILDEMGVPAARAIMVGDTTFDVEMARSAGVRAIGVGWGAHEAQELADAGADLVVSALPDLAPHLPRLLPD